MPSDIHIGFTGTRRGMTIGQAAKVAELLRDADWLHHGDCDGSDCEVNHIARESGVRTASHPPENGMLRAFCVTDLTHQPAPYMQRNRSIVNVTCRLIAAPGGMEEELRSGTWATVRYARRLGKPVTIVFPDGTISNA